MTKDLRKVITTKLDPGDNSAATVREFPKINPAAAEQLGGEEAVRRFFEAMRAAPIDGRLSSNLDAKEKGDRK